MSGLIGQHWLLLIALPFLTLLSSAQTAAADKSTVVQGTLCDSQSQPLPHASVSLRSTDGTRNLEALSDGQGHYRFENVSPGNYRLRVTADGYSATEKGPVTIGGPELQTFDLHLEKLAASNEARGASGVQFSDEPQFQIAGVVDPTNYGGHGSDTVLRTKEALAKDADSLGKESAPSSSSASSPHAGEAELHRAKGDTAEKEGRPLEAVREYQLAAQLDSSESNLFAWAAELLLHRAFEPAVEVFTKGRHQFPGSVRMAVGLGIATYDKGDTERGEQLLLEACDVKPTDATPYLFMGRLQEAEKAVSATWIEKLRRFTEVAPRDPRAHYYYAVALSKQSATTVDNGVVESELRKAIDLDPKLGKAYLQLGIVLAEKKETPAAITFLEKAIENLPLADEAHYRLAQIYRQSGQPEKARSELALYHQTSTQKTRQEEEQRHEIQQFVYTLREPKPDAVRP